MIQDAIDDWSDGATGSITFGGVTTNYTISTPNAIRTNDNIIFDDGQFTTIIFDDPLPGVVFRVRDLDAAFNEQASFTVNGVPVNLEQAIANGDVTLTNPDGTPLPNNGLDVVTGNVLDGTAGAQNEGFQIRFNTSVSSIRFDYLAGGSGRLSLDAFVCFTRGVFIMTQNGACPVEDLSVGDQVLTLDNGLQTVRWIGRRKLGKKHLVLNPKLRPVRIAAGALGEGLPERDLLVSPQHRILARSRIAHRMFGVDEVLIPAKKLLPLEGVSIEQDVDSVEYFHILFDRHEIVFANGAPTESLFAGAEAMTSLSAEARAEIQALFPEISEPGFCPVAARFIPAKGRQIQMFAQRHRLNAKPIFKKDLSAPGIAQSA